MFPIRVVFDTNIFTPENFDALEGSPLRALFLRRRVLPVYSHIFVEETLRVYGSERKRDLLISKWLPFVISTCESICKDFSEIFHEEVICGRGARTRILLPRRQYERFKANLLNVPLDGTWTDWHESHVERECDNQKRSYQKNNSKIMRAEVSQCKKTIGYRPDRHGLPDLKHYLQTELIPTGREFLPTQIPARNIGAVIDRWSRNPSFYPYFTTFIRDILYKEFHAMTKPSDRIDLNAQADLNLMSHLLNAEILVSNECGFIKTAFMDLWKDKGKVLMTGPEFLEYIERL